MTLPSPTETPDADTVLSRALEWIQAGHGVALATVTRTWGSSPCPAGSHLVVRDDGAFEGSVSGGCIEGEVVTEALAAIRNGGGKSLSFGIANEEAWRVGLACGGKVEVYVSALSDKSEEQFAALLAARREQIPTAFLIDMDAARNHLWRQGADEEDFQLSDTQSAALAARFMSDRSGLINDEDKPGFFARIYNPRLRLLICGAVHIAQHLAELAARAGYDVTVIDPRDTWSTPERFPGIKLDRRWPSTAIEDLKPDARTAIVTLSHDPKLDDPALTAALASEAFYVGSLGSRRTHASRISRLKEAGLADNQLGRIYAPIGLDIGAVNPAEIALSALAQITQALRKPNSD